MDNAGRHARRRAAQQDVAQPPARGPDGLFRPVAQVEPMEDSFIGGWTMPVRQPSPRPTPPASNGDGSIPMGVPGPSPLLSAHLQQTGYPFVRPPSTSGLPAAAQHGPRPSSDDSPLAKLSPVERSQVLNLRKTTMQPYLQFMCGPLLRYDTIEDGVWHGAALIVTADAGSTYEPYHPTLKYCWNPKYSAPLQRQLNVQGAQGVDLGPHPADPNALHFGREANDGYLEGPDVQVQRVVGMEIHVYTGRGGTSTYTFWRFPIHIPLAESEMKILYSINDGIMMDFFVPGRSQTMRLAAYSCNGFSAGVNPDDFRGQGFQSGYDPVWVDLLAKHTDQPFHLLVGGGDQVYCDGVVREPEMQEWMNKKPEEKKVFALTDEIRSAIDRFYFNHYCESFRSGAFARANSSIPMLNMLDDHDLVSVPITYFWSLIDTGGRLMVLEVKSPIFNEIGSRGYFFFLLFQCFINVSVDSTDDRTHVFKSVVIGGQGPYVPYPSHSFLTPIGPTAWLLMLDCRAERTLGQVLITERNTGRGSTEQGNTEQVCSAEQYEKVFARLNALPSTVEHLIIQLGIPIAYPRMVFLENALSSKLNPFLTLARTGSFRGLKGFVNKFNGDAELLDDLNDHWTSKHHKLERNWFIGQLQQYALSHRIRVTFLTGDVHCAAVGLLKTLNKGKKKFSAIKPTDDYRYMLNVVTSAIVNTPPPNGVLTLVNSLSAKRHRTMHHLDTDEEMVALFEKDTDEKSKPKSHYIMGRRNWCSITMKQPSGDLLFDIRVEKEQGHGETVGYTILAPPPRWAAKAVT
ncbi:hypothetical protein DFH94DRAFT_693399 [Russula ochroleuca]|uniref:PhoD-like phosphatase domain-containing protein n=1 Tax=Russula ochroleuca TaxID=152965 RepID=A0A9P5T7N3_9AGAM|nr:hypothetical protein DFH94DRAFT_693399 [Russula ochroleuca]